MTVRERNGFPRAGTGKREKSSRRLLQLLPAASGSRQGAGKLSVPGSVRFRAAHRPPAPPSCQLYGCFYLFLTWRGTLWQRLQRQDWGLKQDSSRLLSQTSALRCFYSPLLLRVLQSTVSTALNHKTSD
nr:uncharacterized protein LOC110568656 [Aotus nancymaae]